MRGLRGSGKPAPSSPSVDALTAIAARKAAKIEKSLNKVPAMQLIADQLARENTLKARQGTGGEAAAVEAPNTAEDVDMDSDANSDDESPSSGHNEVPKPAQVISELEGLVATEAHELSSVSLHWRTPY